MPAEAAHGSGTIPAGVSLIRSRPPGSNPPPPLTEAQRLEAAPGGQLENFASSRRPKSGRTLRFPRGVEPSGVGCDSTPQGGAPGGGNPNIELEVPRPLQLSGHCWDSFFTVETHDSLQHVAVRLTIAFQVIDITLVATRRSREAALMRPGRMELPRCGERNCSARLSIRRGSSARR
jgi:hypothetical protein